MTLAYRSGSFVSAGNASGGNLSLNKPTGTVDGDIVVILVYFEPDTCAISINTSGWEAAEIANTGAFKIRAFWKKAASEPTTYTISNDVSGNQWRTAVGLAYSGGTGTGTLLDVPAGTRQADAQNGPNLNAPSVTTTGTNRMVFFGFGDFSGSNPTSTSGFATSLRGAFGGLALTDAVKATAGATGTTNAAGGVGTEDYAAMHVALISDIGGGAPATTTTLNLLLRGRADNTANKDASAISTSRTASRAAITAQRASTNDITPHTLSRTAIAPLSARSTPNLYTRAATRTTISSIRASLTTTRLANTQRTQLSIAVRSALATISTHATTKAQSDSIHASASPANQHTITRAVTTGIRAATGASAAHTIPRSTTLGVRAALTTINTRAIASNLLATVRNSTTITATRATANTPTLSTRASITNIDTHSLAIREATGQHNSTTNTQTNASARAQSSGIHSSLATANPTLLARATTLGIHAAITDAITRARANTSTSGTHVGSDTANVHTRPSTTTLSQHDSTQSTQLHSTSRLDTSSIRLSIYEAFMYAFSKSTSASTKDSTAQTSPTTIPRTITISTSTRATLAFIRSHANILAGSAPSLSSTVSIRAIARIFAVTKKNAITTVTTEANTSTPIDSSKNSSVQSTLTILPASISVSESTKASAGDSSIRTPSYLTSSSGLREAISSVFFRIVGLLQTIIRPRYVPSIPATCTLTDTLAATCTLLTPIQDTTCTITETLAATCVLTDS